MTATTKIKYVVSDSMSAILNYARGRISLEASAILKSGFRNDARTDKIYLIWAPAHSGLAGNECEHDAARGFTDRADIDPNTTFAHSLRWSGRDGLVSYRDITNHYRIRQARFPPAYPSLNKRQSATAAPGRRITQVEQWETVLLSSDPADQNWAIQLAEDAARAQGPLADA
ncbi:hypothetical protein HPB47_027447 [Ixodes persulcatus]|uniref:Uncharacterized protein n=1 Tax=Ixodes persulcatus TaxID=34615 RepID=A0AC60PXG8_IXOPE|nr:hypothetical protein HPB47_027447 [Ixodes persulcatus]